jgi:hypothetical protein
VTLRETHHCTSSKRLNECFANQDYHVGLPSSCFYDEFPEDEKANWDPNNPGIFENQRDAKWLKATWEEYLCPKYKKGLDKWNNDTGGGDGCPTSFINFVGGDRWLVWVFCIDRDVNFLLANLAAGRMPCHLQLEGGFEDDIDSSVTESETTTDGTRKRARIENSIDSVAAQQRDIGNLKNAAERIVGYLELREKQRQQETASAKVGESLKEVATISKMMEDNDVLKMMSPETQETYKTSLKNQRRSILDNLSEQ